MKKNTLTVDSSNDVDNYTDELRIKITELDMSWYLIDNAKIKLQALLDEIIDISDNLKNNLKSELG